MNGTKYIFQRSIFQKDIQQIEYVKFFNLSQTFEEQQDLIEKYQNIKANESQVDFSLLAG